MVREHSVGLQFLLAGFLIAALGLGPGCSSGKEAAAGGTGRDTTGSGVSNYMHDMALQHFIEGSLWEMKGDNAQAVLEYQDALRYEPNDAIYYALSKNYAELNKNALAIEAGREAVKRDPENLEYRRNLAAAYAAAFETDTAAQEYEEIVKRDSSSLEAWYNLARLYQTRKPLRALDLYQQITNRFGPEWEVLLQTAELSNKLGKFDTAAEALRQMTEIDPGNKALQQTLAQTYIRASEYDKALRVLGELHEGNPEDLDVLGEIAGVHLLTKQYNKAADEFEPILARDSVSMEAKLHIGEMYFSQLEKDSTLAPYTKTIFERIRKKYPQDWRAYWFLGAIGAVTHDDSLSVRNFRKVTELASWNADAWVYLSSVFLEKNNFNEVARVLEAALKVVPDDFRVNFLLGVAYNRIGQNEDAVRVLEHARQINGKDIDAITQLALVYDGLKRFDQSDSLYELALRMEPNKAIILNNYSYSLADRGVQLDRALKMAQQAVEVEPENASYLDTMGWIYFRLGKYKDAEKYVKQAIGKGEVSAVVYEHLGDIYYKMNNKEGALEQWNIALQLDGNNPALRDKIMRGSL